MSFKHCVIAFRLHAQLMTWSAILTYFSYAKNAGKIVSYKGFIPVAISAVFFHMAVNSISEYRDYVNGIDSKESKGASQLPLAYLHTPKVIYYLGFLCFTIAVISGLFAVYFVGKILFIPGILIGFLVFSYSEKPISYKYKALGELSVFFVFGPILAYSCLYALCGDVSLQDLLVSISIGLLVACVMLANNIRDYQFDLSISNKTLPTFFGLKYAYGLLFSMANLAYLIVLFIPNIRPWPILITYPIIFLSVKYINKHEFFNVFLGLQFAFCISFVFSALCFR